MFSKILLLSLTAFSASAIANNGFSIKGLGGSSLRSSKPEAYNPTFLGVEVGFVLPGDQNLDVTVTYLSNPKKKVYLPNNQTEEAGAFHVMGGINYWFSSNFGSGMLLAFTKQTQTLENPGSGLEEYNNVTIGARAIFETEVLTNVMIGAEVQVLWIPKFNAGVTLANLGFVKIKF